MQVEPAAPAFGGKRRRKRSTGAAKEGKRRSASEGRRRAGARTDVSRDSSTASSAMSLDVRCACQYFQSDSLLPDRINPVGARPGSRLSNVVAKIGDHEYEPINPPPDNVGPVVSLVGAAPPTVHVIDTDQGLSEKPASPASSTTSLERRMLGADAETSPEETLTIQEMQTEIENKYFGRSAEPPSQLQTTVHTVTTITTTETKSQPPKSAGPGRFQQAFKTQTDKFKNKLHEIKKPNIKLPSRPTIKKPNLQKFKFEKPKINLPKLPEAPKISLPTFSLPRKSQPKRSLKERQLSTESNAGGSKKNYFDFRTYPRLFKKKPKDDLDSFSSKGEREVPEFATVPRTKRNKEDDKWGGRESIRIPLHAQEPAEDEEREDSVERRMASHMRYDQDIDIDDAYEKENQEIHTASPFSHGYNSRWNHGSFHPPPNEEFSEDTANRQVTDLDSPGDGPAPHESFDTNTSKDMHSSESSLGIHRRGVLEEIDSDEFFLRQKGISQDNIEVGMYLSSEIREAFKYPTNALADLQRHQDSRHLDFSYDPRASNQSLPETPSKRKAVKKPKRKKTPHVSQEQISFDQDSELDLEIPPSRPKRRSRRNKKQKESEGIVPYQETIAVPDVTVGILRSGDDREHLMYENEQMQGKEQPEIQLVDPYDEYRARYDSEDEVFREEVKEEFQPSAPPRKHRSLKSLSYSEHDSILGDVDPDREPLPDDVQVYKTEHEYIIPTPELPPIKPPRTLSRSSSKSHENDEIRNEFEESPVRPTRVRSRSRTHSQGDSLTLEEPEEVVEEPCVIDIRDSMGYAIIDKNVRREPPLPPPRTPPRRRRGVQSSEQGFFTVPRPVNDEPPTRPIRNYSTLGPSRPPRRKQPVNMTDEEKENIDITQYIEIEDEPNRDLNSGDVIQKMRDRPLPAPPRPPRKTRTLQDITSQENIVTQSQEDLADERKLEFLEEAEVSTQTEPLPDDFVCEEEVQEVHVPRETSRLEQSEPVVVERRLITPTQYSFEETITHGSLIVEPLNGAKILPDSELTRPRRSTERIVPVTRDYDDETSEIPEEFSKLRDPEPPASVRVQPTEHPPVQTGPPQPSVIERIIERPSGEIEVLKAQKLQVSDLDVDRLSVNELLASRIIVSEIEGGRIQANEISSKSGALKVGEIELPPGIVQQLFEKLQSVVHEQQSSGPTEPAAETSAKEASDEAGQKKTPFELVVVETLPPQRPPRKTEESCETSVPPVDASIEPSVDIVSTQIDSLNISETEEIQGIQETVEPSLQEIRERIEAEIEEIHETADPLSPAIKQTEEAVKIEETLEIPTPIQAVEPFSDGIEDVRETIREIQEMLQTLEPSEQETQETVEASDQETQRLKPTDASDEESPGILETIEPSCQDIHEIQETVEPPLPPVRTDSSIKPAELAAALAAAPELEETKEQVPQRPPRHAEKIKRQESGDKVETESKEKSPVRIQPQLEDPEVDDEPPPRPPEPPIDYTPSQPPASFYALRAQKYVESLEGDIPMAPRRRRHPKPPISGSSSEESPVPPPSRRRYRSPEPSIPQLTGQLIHACGSAAQSSIKRLIAHITNNVLRNADGQQDTNVMIIILLVLIASLILIRFGDGQTVHYHHWEFFNPPRDM